MSTASSHIISGHISLDELRKIYERIRYATAGLSGNDKIEACKRVLQPYDEETQNIVFNGWYSSFLEGQGSVNTSAVNSGVFFLAPNMRDAVIAQPGASVVMGDPTRIAGGPASRPYSGQRHVSR